MRKFLVPIILIFCIGCSEKPNLSGFNSDIWKKDKAGCEGKRSILVDTLLAQVSLLKGIKEDQLTQILGKPEKYIPQDRGKKSWHYYTQNGSQCDKNLILEGPKIVVEFDALGRVSLVTEKKF
jgi:hypothetical protein